MLWSSRCNDKALVGMVKETVRQVSHSKKWKSQRVLDEQEKPAFDYKGRPLHLLPFSTAYSTAFNTSRLLIFDGFRCFGQ